MRNTRGEVSVGHFSPWLSGLEVLPAHSSDRVIIGLSSLTGVYIPMALYAQLEWSWASLWFCWVLTPESITSICSGSFVSRGASL